MTDGFARLVAGIRKPAIGIPQRKQVPQATAQCPAYGGTLRGGLLVEIHQDVYRVDVFASAATPIWRESAVGML